LDRSRDGAAQICGLMNFEWQDLDAERPGGFDRSLFQPERAERRIMEEPRSRETWNRGFQELELLARELLRSRDETRDVAARPGVGWMSPVPIGSLDDATMTMGIVFVASRAALSDAGPAAARMTSTLRRTSSVAACARPSGASTMRRSMRRFRPSIHPR